MWSCRLTVPRWLALKVQHCQWTAAAAQAPATKIDRSAPAECWTAAAAESLSPAKAGETMNERKEDKCKDSNNCSRSRISSKAPSVCVSGVGQLCSSTSPSDWIGKKAADEDDSTHKQAQNSLHCQRFRTAADANVNSLMGKWQIECLNIQQ